MTIKTISLDHSQPLSREGTNAFKNLCCMCLKCNRLKSDLNKGEFDRFLKFLNRPINTDMKTILIRRLGMSNALFGRKRR